MSDKNYITYDDFNNPVRIQFDNGNVTKYVYSATGQKLRTIHYTAVENTHISMGCDLEDIEDIYLAVDSTDYLLGGSVIYVNEQLSKILFDGGYVDASYAGGPHLSYKYYNRDHLGNNREVVDESGAVLQRTDYYPFGTPFSSPSSTINAGLQPFKYNNKELDMMHGLNTYDYGARQYYPLLPMWDRVDPLAEDNPGVSPYMYCAGDPVNKIDPDGRDTVCVNKIDDKWIIENPIISKGDDVFIIKDGDKTETITYAEGEYGERVCALNLEINDSYTLGVYYVSGAGNKGCGYYVTPGGDSSTMTGSGKRIPEGCYPILPPNGGAWQQPQVGGVVADRGIRFHYGYLSPREWTEGCFVLSNDYYITGGKIQFPKLSSLSAIQEFDKALGGGSLYKYVINRKGKKVTRMGSKFPNGIKHKLYLKRR